MLLHRLLIHHRLIAAALAIALIVSGSADAARIKDVAMIEGVRENQLIG